MPGIHNVKKTASLIDGVEETGYLIQRNEIGQLSYNIHRNQFKMDKRQKSKAWNNKMLRWKPREIGSRSWTWQWFLGYDTKSQTTKAKIDTRGYVKLKPFCTEKDQLQLQQQKT